MRNQFTDREMQIFSELYSLGYSQKKIADLGGVSQATISRLLKTLHKEKTYKKGVRIKK